jgi:hypothetical protein
VGYSDGMTTKTAPDLTPGYPSKGAKLGPAWEAVWAELTKAARRKDPFVEGRDLAQRFASDYGLAPSTLVAVLSRAAKAKLLVADPRPVQTNRGVRNRNHYKIKTDD